MPVDVPIKGFRECVKSVWSVLTAIKEVEDDTVFAAALAVVGDEDGGVGDTAERNEEGQEDEQEDAEEDADTEEEDDNDGDEVVAALICRYAEITIDVLGNGTSDQDEGGQSREKSKEAAGRNHTE